MKQFLDAAEVRTSSFLKNITVDTAQRHGPQGRTIVFRGSWTCHDNCAWLVERSQWVDATLSSTHLALKTKAKSAG
jgi:hypothetical protein